MRGSQYTDVYLNCTADPETRYTVGTFLHYQLAGKAKRYADRYERVLVKDLERLRAAGEVDYAPSVHGATAYVRTAR
jgi:hypothetical protein